MKIKWLKIPNFRNLRDFEINFDESQPTTVLLGHNGSGKSNLQEAIVEIFRELESGKSASFAYSIKYTCYDNSIDIEADPEASRKLRIIINDKSISQTEFNKNKEFYLPQYIFGYYSGWSSRLERQFDEKTRRYYDEILRNSDNDMPLRRFFFCRREYSQLVLLAFFLANDLKSRKLINDYLDIEGFESALFVMRRPWWGRSGRVLNNEPVDSRFWNARGAFRPFLSRLWESALAPIRNTETVERDVRHRGESTERIYLYIKNEEQLGSLRSKYESTKLFFANLESLFLCDLIDEVRVKVIKKDGSKVTFNQLSEGEQQLLTVLGLLLFTQDEESLYLLDEPDTHLNPVWTYDYLRLLQESIQTDKGQLIVTTHDPLMIGSLYKNQVRVLSQSEQMSRADEPVYEPLGIGIEGLLKSELYGLQSTLAPDILAKLNRHYLLLGKRKKTEDEQIELIQLAQELNDLGVSRTHPNPYFELFANAMAKRMPKPEAKLSKEDIEEQTQLAEAIMDEILAEEQEDKEG